MSDIIETTTDPRLEGAVRINVSDLPEASRRAMSDGVTVITAYPNLHSPSYGLAVIEEWDASLFVGDEEPGWPITSEIPIDGATAPSALLGRRGWWIERVVIDLFVADNGTKFLRDNIATLEAAIARLEGENGRLSDTLGTACMRHEADIAKIGERLLSEANDRGWCSEFDQIVDDLNTELYVELPTRERDFEVEVEVTYRVTVTVTARDEDMARDRVNDDWGYVEMAMSSWSPSIDDITITDVSEA